MIKIELEEWQVKNLREYFGENDKTQTEHWAYDVFNKAYKEQCNIPDVVHCKTPKKIAVVGCGDAGITVARGLAEKGFEVVAMHDIENSPLTLQDIRPPVDIEPLILENTLPDNPFHKPQNRADRRKQARNKGKKKNR